MDEIYTIERRCYFDSSNVTKEVMGTLKAPYIIQFSEFMSKTILCKWIDEYAPDYKDIDLNNEGNDLYKYSLSTSTMDVEVSESEFYVWKYVEKEV